MDRTADAVVIGGGIMGASVAHFLAKKDFGKVLLLEKRTLAAVSTGHSAAAIRQHYSNPLTLKLVLRAVNMFENDRDELGGDCGFRRTGWLMVLHQDGVSPAQRVVSMQRRHGIEVTELSLADLEKMVPQVNLDQVVGAIFEPSSGYADPIRTTRALVERAKQWGLVVHEGVGATDILLEGHRVRGVDTEHGTIDTRVVVNAAGPWGRHVGLWAGRNYSLRWSRESDLVLRLPEDFGPLPILTDTNLNLYCRPQAQHQLLAGLGWPKEVEPLNVNDYDPQLDARTRQRIEQKLFYRLPDARYGTYVNGWASIYTITDDWHPIVGAEPDLEGYFAFFGGSGHGFKLGPPIGEALADVIAGSPPDIDIHALRPSRFAEGELFSSAWGSGNRG